MITIRRLYQYIVCFISLQAAAGALTALLGGLIRWLTGRDADGVFFTLQLAILIVATPIFLGHWLWVLYLARRDPEERNAFSYRLYLYATQAMFLAGLAGAVFGGVETLARAGIGYTDPLDAFSFNGGGQTFASVAGGVGANFVTFVLMGALWFYHYALAARKDLAQTTGSRVLYHVYTQGWAGAGTVLAAFGLFLFQSAVIAWLARDPNQQLPIALALLATGLPLWVYHELHRARARHLAEPAGDLLRWLGASGFSGLAALVFLFSLAALFAWFSDRVFGNASRQPPLALAAVTTSLALWVYHEWAIRRVSLASMHPVRWFYALLFSAIGLVAAASGGVLGIQWLFTGLPRGAGEFALGSALLVPGLIVWAYHQWLLGQTGRVLSLDAAEPGPFRAGGRFIRRLYVLLFSGAGVVVATLGLIGVQEALFTGLRGELGLGRSLAWLVVGVAVWVYHWVWASRLFARNLPDERRSDLRKGYLYLIIFAAVNTVIVTAGLTLNGVFRSLLNLPTQGGLGLSVAVILAAVALWVYHALVLRGDIARAGESALQAGMQRLYWYLVAAFGLSAFLVGLAAVLGVALNWLADGLRADAFLRGRLASNLAAVIAGFPVWFLAWWPAQRLARQSGPDGASARRSWLRRLYLYGFSLVAVVTTLVNAIAVIYQVLNAIFNLSGGGNALAEIAQAAGLAVIFTAVWLFHGWVLRLDGRHAAADAVFETEKQTAARALAAEKQTAARAAATATRAARWAGVPILVVDDGDGAFARTALSVLRREMPTLSLLTLGLTPAAVAALAAEPLTAPPAQPDAISAPPAAEAPPAAPPAEPAAVEPTPSDGRPLPASETADPLTVACLIVAPWTAAAHPRIAGSLLPKVIVPTPGPGLTWVGLTPTTDLAALLPRAVAAALATLED